MVKIDDEKPGPLEAVMPIDPVSHVQVNNNVGNMLVMVRVDNQNLHLGYLQTMFQIDGQMVFAGNPPGQMTVQNAALPMSKDGKQRNGTLAVYQIGKLTITQEREVVPTRSKGGEKRRREVAEQRYKSRRQVAAAHQEWA